jgi:YidC/Oxa1 family membrane protein insertase
MLSLNPAALMSTALAYLSTTLAPIGGAVAAIVILTILIRLALHPLTRAAVRGERAKARLSPQVAALRRRHGSDLARLTQETQALYRAERISPFAGMLPALVQLPVVFVLYRAFLHGGAALDRARLFGVPLHMHFLAAIGSTSGALVFGGVLAILAVLAWANSRRTAMLLRVAGAAAEIATAGPVNTETPKARPVKGGERATAGSVADTTSAAEATRTPPDKKSAPAKKSAPVKKSAAPKPTAAVKGRPATHGKPPARRDAPGTPTTGGTTTVGEIVPANAIAAVGRIAPYFLLLSGVILPLATGIYLVTTTAWSLAENTMLRRGLP